MTTLRQYIDKCAISCYQKQIVGGQFLSIHDDSILYAGSKQLQLDKLIRHQAAEAIRCHTHGQM